MISNEDEDETSLNDESCCKKIKLSNEKISKFEELKQKRIELKLKHERKQLKKVKSKPVNTNLDDKDNISHNEKNVNNELNKVLIKKLELNLDKAIQSNDIDLAEQLSDKLASKQNELNADSLFKTNSLNNKKKNKLKWTFDPKQRWETKSNM